MSDILEVAFTSDANGGPWTSAVWDTRTGTNLMTYRGGGSSGARSLSFIRNEFLISANSTKPLIHIWPVNSQEQIQTSRFVTPGRVTSLAVSPDGNFCVAGIAENVYIWQICSGKMLACLSSRHYQPVTTVKFTDDGSHFISAAQDGMIIVTNLSKAVCNGSANTQIEPLYTFSDHALSITDLYVGHGGIRALLCSVSTDRTCKIYDLSYGSLLLSLIFQEPLTCVTFDHLESCVYAGTTEGSIYEFSISPPPRVKEFHLKKDDLKNKFTGHVGAVTCVSVSVDGETLMSGGADENVLVWHIPSKQLIRTLPHKGPITNAFFTFVPGCMFDQEVKLNLIVNNFQRMIDSGGDVENNVVEVLISDKIEDEIEQFNQKSGPRNGNNSALKEIKDLRKEVENLKRINKELFEYSVKQVLK